MTVNTVLLAWGWQELDRQMNTDEPSSAANWRRCPQCDGSGKKVVTADDGSQSSEYCPACGGVGGWYETPKDQVIG